MSELNKESVEQAGGDERAAFDAYRDRRNALLESEGHKPGSRWHVTNAHYPTWEASRAALAQPSPAQPEQAEAERPEVAEVAFVLRNIGAMDAEDIDGDNVDLRFEDAEGRDTGCDVSIVEYAEKAADLLEQHERIVGDLRADRDSWAEQAEQRLADWDEMRKERDAALARVEQQERTIAGMNEAHAKLAGLYEAAQAQHSVPEEFSFEYRHPNGESHTVTVSRDQVINEMPDYLFEALCSKFCNCEPVGETNVVECSCDEYAEEFKLLAGAPGKEGV
ncbi:TPA: hypothetical protein ACGW3C_000671 [Pseudomonas aeruginosa]